MLSVSVLVPGININTDPCASEKNQFYLNPNKYACLHTHICVQGHFLTHFLKYKI